VLAKTQQRLLVADSKAILGEWLAMGWRRVSSRFFIGQELAIFTDCG
jgi:hypothetical protein